MSEDIRRSPSRMPAATADRLLAAVRSMQDLHVVVLGDVMLDVYDFCLSEASKPIDSEKPGKRAYAAHESVRRMGGAGNVATNLAALGARTTLVGVVGNDGYRHTLGDLCAECGITHILIRDARRPTTTKTRIYIDDEYLLRKDHESGEKVDRETGVSLVNEVARALRDGAAALILSDYNKGVFTPEVAGDVLRRAAETRLPVIVDFKPPNRDLFKGAPLIVPNESEADILLPGFRATDDLEGGLRALRESLCAEMVSVTLGARGICGFDGEEFFHHHGHAVQAIDAVGCGDTVRAVLSLGLACDLTLSEAAALANAAAAVIVQKPATATLSAEELQGFVRDFDRRSRSRGPR